MNTKPAASTGAGLALLLLVSSCSWLQSSAEEGTSPADSVASAVPAQAQVEEEAEPEPEEEPEPEPEEEEALTIRDIEFADLEWTEWVNEQIFVPAVGFEDEHWFHLGEEIVYEDVNGDGHEDALVPIGQTEERWMERIWYIWAWDPEKQEAYQASGPVARAAECGDRVLSVSAEDGAFIIHEQLWPQGADVVCAAEPPVEVTRHIVLEDDWETMISPARAFGGMCPQILRTDDGWPVEDYEFRTAPVETASLVGDPDPVFFIEADVWSRLWLFYPQWMLVHLGFSNPAEGPPVMPNGYTPCGWVYLENDDRPVPHDPYLPED